MNRRDFLRSLGWSAAGITVTFAAGCAPMPPIPKRPLPQAAEGLAWIQLGSDGRFSLIAPRHELGQNILTALKQIAAEELGVDLALIDARVHDTDEIPIVRATVGSESIKAFALPLARAAATLRESIVERAAAQLQLAKDAVRILPSGIAVGDGREIAFARIVGESPAVLADAAPDVVLRSFAAGEKRVVGKAARLHEVDEIVTGQALFVADVRLPDMLHGAILRPPTHALLGGRLVSLDERAAKAIPGFFAVVREKVGERELVGAVAANPWSLRKVVAALAPQWTTQGSFDGDTIDRLVDVDQALAKGGLRHSLAAATVVDEGRWDVDLRIDLPLAAHAAIEPRAAVARFDSERKPRLELWAGSQSAFYVRDYVAWAMDLAKDDVLVHSRRVGGGFGARATCTVELEAALLSRAAGRPVKVQWSRPEEFQQSYHRPPFAHRLRIRLGPGGKMTDWHHAFLSSHIIFTNALLPPWMQALTDFVGDQGVARGALAPYAVTRKRIEFDARPLPVYTGPWRGLGAGPNGLAIETAVDEAARVAGRDPLAFRLAHLPDEHVRLKRCLEAVARLATWRGAEIPRAVGDTRTAQGLACGIYNESSYVAVIAEAEVDSASGQVRLLHLFAAHDCGQVINPDQVRAQVEGNLVWGIGMVLKERLAIENSQIKERYFGEYSLPSIRDVPPMTIELIADGRDPPSGAGETAIVAAAGAIGNALSRALERRITRFPVHLGTAA